MVLGTRGTYVGLQASFSRRFAAQLGRLRTIAAHKSFALCVHIRSLWNWLHSRIISASCTVMNLYRTYAAYKTQFCLYFSRIMLFSLICVFSQIICVFCSTLIPLANQWLRENVDATLVKCETIEKKIKSADEVTSRDPLFTPRGTQAVYVKGLR